RRRKRLDRLHLVEGLMIALLNIDEVIQVIRSSDDASSAKDRLMTVLELSAILESESRLRELVSTELASVAERFANPRRTVLLEGTGAPRTAVVPLEVADDPCLVLLSSTGLVARTPISTAERDPGDLFSAGTPAGQGGPAAVPRSAHDVMVSSVAATARGSVA